ncbi:MAG: hypothetical protein LBQ46_04700 [Treponema sp.]|jgi:hypothetical protein|nr:hypothetical protein [Treponema sp.]
MSLLIISHNQYSRGRIGGAALAAALLFFFAGCELNPGLPGPGSKDGAGENPGGETENPGAAPPSAPALLDTAVRYNAAEKTVEADFSFDVDVIAPAASAEDYPLSGSGGKTLTVTLTGTAGTAAAVSFTVSRKDDPSKTLAVNESFMPVDGPFTRPQSPAAYRVVYADSRGAAGLQPEGGDTAWCFVEDDSLNRIFNAIYSPNAVNVRDLFRVTLGADEGDDRLTITGTPPAKEGDGLTVIEVGLPGADNSGLPKFYIPYRGLGVPDGDYAHIRLRVNRGAHLVIEANNNPYIANGESCPAGYLKNGSVEVMGGGKLRYGAYKGSPLGENTVITARLGSYLAAGPESSFGPETAGYDPDRDAYYRAWLIGPAAAGPRISWDAGDQHGGFIEFRRVGNEDRLAFDADLTVKKTVVLDRSVWFFRGPSLTVDAAGDTVTPVPGNGPPGLYAGGAYAFYGTTGMSGGQNPSNEMAKVVIKQGSAVAKRLLSGENTDSSVEAVNADKVIRNEGKLTGNFPLIVYTMTPLIYGYLNWSIP